MQQCHQAARLLLVSMAGLASTRNGYLATVCFSTTKKMLSCSAEHFDVPSLRFANIRPS